MGSNTENDHTSGSRDAKPTTGAGHVFEVGYVPHARDAAQVDAAQAGSAAAQAGASSGDAREDPKAATGAPPFPGRDAPAAASTGREPLPVKERKRRRRTRIIAAVAVAVVALLGGGYAVASHNQQVAHEEAVARKEAAKKRRQEEQAKAIRVHDEYVSNLNKVYGYMMGGAVTSETACNLTSGVWHDAIFGGWDDETSPYQASDFNDALKKLYESEKYQGYASSIEDSNDKIDDIMRELTDPPSDCESAYDTLQDLYPEYQSFASLATDPSGSYTTYTQKFEEADSTVSSKIQLLSTQIPDAIKSDDSSSS